MRSLAIMHILIKKNQLRACFLFNFNLVCYMYVGFTNIFSVTSYILIPLVLLLYILLLPFLTFYDLKSHSIVIPMSIYALEFLLLSICFIFVSLRHHLYCI